MVLVIVPPYFTCISGLSLASGRLRAFLVQCLNEQIDSRGLRLRLTFKAVKALNRFSNKFRFWLSAVFFCFLLTYAFEMQTSIPDAIPHLFAVATYRMYIHLGQTMMNYCLPGRSSLILISPEQRLWKLTSMLLSIMSRFSSSKIMARIWEICCSSTNRRSTRRVFPEAYRPPPLESRFSDGMLWSSIMQSMPEGFVLNSQQHGLNPHIANYPTSSHPTQQFTQPQLSELPDSLP